MNIATKIDAPVGAASFPRAMYARLGKDISLHVTPSYGTLFCGNPPELHTVSADLASLLAGCDGSRRIDEILDAYLGSGTRGDDGAAAVAIAKFVDYLRDDTIELTIERNAGEIGVTGSPKAYIPTHIQVELTTQCNLGCDFCYRRASSDGKDDRLDTDALLNILEDMRRWGLRSVELTGGEPLMHKNFQKILD
ncbi:MAG: radical SAM protein, partial [Hyphomicrobiales bacterium]|nr:radical SAM protein [Hyphomicrobiales bacterium]